MSNPQLDNCLGSTLSKCSTSIQNLFPTNLDMYELEFQVCGSTCEGTNIISNDLHESLYKASD